MKLLSLKSFSLIGLLLIAASALISALEPSLVTSLKIANGVLATGETNNTHTCIPADISPNCHDSKSDGPLTLSSSSGAFASTTEEAGNTTTGDAA